MQVKPSMQPIVVSLYFSAILMVSYIFRHWFWSIETHGLP
ncbi:unnamed protein product [Brassica rapa subsp. trilocularis]